MKTDTRRFTEDEIRITAQTDLPALFEDLGYTVIPIGSYFTAKEMDSLRIKNRRTWFRYSEQVGGDAITFLQHFKDMTFTEAVEYLLSDKKRAVTRLAVSHKREPQTDAQCEFVLPKPNDGNLHVFAYLRKRGISPRVINEFIRSGLLYEEAAHHNCVFVGRDAQGKPVFASMRGTCDLSGVSFKGGVPGSDKDVGFRLPYSGNSNTAYVFEAPIDLMSYLTLNHRSSENAVALCCLYDGPLERLLSDYPQLKSIVFCLDNDRWGREAAGRMASKYMELGYRTEIILPPSGKDWNEYLQEKNARAKRREVER